ncbi:MAG: ParB N-terminal domain-containing protein [Thermoleophilia bacterium]|nr:ParB N-terminal domain-containing protein [Thermoleophilia bacterium]
MDQASANPTATSTDILTEPVSASGIPVHCAHDEIADIETLVPNPRNPNRHSEEQIRLLSKIIRHQGWRAPITVSTRSGFIVRGHGRLAAAKLLGVDLVPLDRQDYASEAEEWADLVADNRLSELNEMDPGSLKDLLQELDAGLLEVLGADMELTGYTEQAFAELMSQFHTEEEPEEVEAPEPPANPVTRPGDLWLLGQVVQCPRCGRLTDV